MVAFRTAFAGLMFASFAWYSGPPAHAGEGRDLKLAGALIGLTEKEFLAAIEADGFHFTPDCDHGYSRWARCIDSARLESFASYFAKPSGKIHTIYLTYFPDVRYHQSQDQLFVSLVKEFFERYGGPDAVEEGKITYFGDPATSDPKLVISYYRHEIIVRLSSKSVE